MNTLVVHSVYLIHFIIRHILRMIVYRFLVHDLHISPFISYIICFAVVAWICYYIFHKYNQKKKFGHYRYGEGHKY